MGRHFGGMTCVYDGEWLAGSSNVPRYPNGRPLNFAKFKGLNHITIIEGIKLVITAQIHHLILRRPDFPFFGDGEQHLPR